MTRSACSGLSALMLLFAAAGCSNGRVPTYPTSGQVLFADGSPVRMGTIELRSREHGIHARGDIDAEGRFVLTTYEAGDGAVAGMHDCVVVQMVIVEEIANFHPSTDGIVHPRFGSYSSSGLMAEVAETGRNDLRVIVEPLHDDTQRSRPRSPQHDHEHSLTNF